MPNYNFFCWGVNVSGCARGPYPGPQLPTNQGSRRFSQIIQLSIVFYSLSFFFLYTSQLHENSWWFLTRFTPCLCVLTPLSLFVLFTLLFMPKDKKKS